MTTRGFAPRPPEPAWVPEARDRPRLYKSGLRGTGDVRHAARMEESNEAYWFAYECVNADPETFEPIRGRRPSSVGRYPAQDRTSVVRNHAARNRGDTELPEFAVVRTGPQTAHVVHTPSGIEVTDEMPIPEAMKRQQTITEVFVKMGRVAA